MKSFNTTKQSLSRGFTLVEMMVIAPIVILAIGAFITLIVNLTGEIMSSRGSNTVTYNVQNALNRIEEDIKLSAGFLQTNSIKFTASNPQGMGGANSVTDFTAAGDSTTGPALILNSLVTDGNPLSLSSRLIYMANQPNGCGNAAEYVKNRPMTMNIIYFIKDDTLWRRTVMPTGYDVASNYCGSKAPWQRPSCVTATSHTFCKANDERLVDNVSASGFSINYFNSASSSTPINPTNNTVLQPATTAMISITSNSTIAGREIVGGGSLKASRLDTNASALGEIVLPTTVPVAPNVSYKVSEGHRVLFSWPRVAGATQYTVQYKAGAGPWVNGDTRDNNNRIYEITDGWNGENVSIRVVAHNVVGPSSQTQVDMTIPIWAPLPLKNNWTDYGSPHVSAAYTRTKSGVIVLKGLVKNGTGTIGVLPEDYRPDKSIMFASAANQTFGRLDVNPSGDVNPTVGTGWFSLEGVTFMPAGTTFTALGYQNGWTTYDSYWNEAGYTLDDQGRVHVRGLIRSGTTAGGTPALTMPLAARAPEYTHWAQVATNAMAHVSYVPASTSIAAKGYTNTFLSVNAMYYTASRVDGTNCATQWCTLPLQNGWLYYGAPYSTPRYTIGTDGIVKLKGLIRAGTAATMATLPAGYCPKQRPLLTVVTADVWGRLDIAPQSNGTCTIEGGAYNAAWVSLDGIQYLAE